ncbi:MAG: RHS repeat-associated core domain-containing protein, partial [Polyangia bacterium]
MDARLLRRLRLSGKRYHLYTDHLGCPELVLDATGKIVWRARIDAYGTAHVDVGNDFHQPLRWPGHYFDAETGLHDNRFRTYSPELGRYLQCDP